MAKQITFNFFSKVILSVVLLAAGSAAAESSVNALNKNWTKHCRVTAIRPLNQYILKNEFKCYANKRQVKKLRFTQYLPQNRSNKKFSSPCPFLAVPKLRSWFSGNNLQCFKSTKAAERAYFRRFVPPTSLNFSFNLGPTRSGSGFAGHCIAALNTSRTVLSTSCTHNVTNATEAHLHIVPNNTKSCVIANPSSEFMMTCALTPSQGAGVFAGNGLIAIHNAPGAPGEVVAGLIRNQ